MVFTRQNLLNSVLLPPLIRNTFTLQINRILCTSVKQLVTAFLRVEGLFIVMNIKVNGCIDLAKVNAEKMLNFFLISLINSTFILYLPVTAIVRITARMQTSVEY